MYLRDPLTGEGGGVLTLAQLGDDLNVPMRTWSGVPSEIHVRLAENGQPVEEPTIEFRGRIIPANAGSLRGLANYFEIPEKYIDRVSPKLRQAMLHEALNTTPGNLTLRYTDDGLTEVHPTESRRIDPTQVLDVAIDVLGPNAQVTNWVNGPELYIDAVVPDGASFGVGGLRDLVLEDPDRRQVGDITKGGLRFGQDRKKNLAPWVQPYLYRLWCTNGMESRDEGLKVDTRGQSVEEVLASLNASANRAFLQVEQQMEAFYELLEQRVTGDLTQTVIRTAQEQGLSAHAAHSLALQVPTITGDDGSTNMFEITNLITNHANLPGMRNSMTRQRSYQIAGGNLVREHHDRCPRCQQAV
jgi:hypothetical protein